MLPKNQRWAQSQASTSLKGDDGSHCDSGQETERKKKVRWEHNSNTMDSDKNSKCLEKVVIFSDFSFLRVDEIHPDIGCISCTYYDSVTCVVYVMEDTEESLHFDLTVMLLEQSNPDIVFTSSHGDDTFIDTLCDHMDAKDGVFQIRPHMDFVASKGRDQLLSLQLLSELPSSVVGKVGVSDIESSTSGSTWNVYDFMQKRWEVKGDPLDDGIGGLEVQNIEILSLLLQIFENESHASVHSDRTKEGFTKTSLGHSLMQTWLLRPSLSLPNLIFASVMHNHLKGIKNVLQILGLLKMGRAKLSDWQGLVKFTFHSAMLRDNLIELHRATNVDIVKQLISTLDITSFREAGTKINEIVDWEESANVGWELDNRKHVYHSIDSILSTVAEQICKRMPIDCASSLNVVYFPQLDRTCHILWMYVDHLSGFLICMPMLDEWHTEAGIQTIDGSVTDMDIHIGDLHSLIVDREIEIIQELLEDILIYDQSMSHACHVCAELDCLLSFAEVSLMYNYQRPQMVEENIIDIFQGRHPLQEQVIDNFVPNDAHIAGGSVITSDLRRDNKVCNSTLLCTGANACGKVCVFNPPLILNNILQIFTQISTRESISKVQSAFMIDLNQVSFALCNSTAHSLVILDEFGKGTLSTGSLLCGVLKHFLQCGINCPKVLVATHFHDLFREDLLDPDLSPISFRHMQVMFMSSNDTILNSCMDTSELVDIYQDDHSCRHKVGIGEKITYLYRVAEGLCMDSHAAKCAEIFGVPSHLAQQAQYVSQLVSTHELA
ncbi:hypothetical protein L208DRAFT_1420391 [Tricholoma matsutake]|nr:hypothetical protein L208DRAFT_1420391 [Tricholoma matsutake 945]